MRAYLLPALALFAVGCADPPAAPTSVPPADPEPSAVSVEIDPTTARVGEIVTFTYRLTTPLDRSVDIWTESTTPSGAVHESAVDFSAGTTTRVFNTGYIPADWVGTWAKRIQGDRLPDGVVLGEPTAGTFTVVP